MSFLYKPRHVWFRKALFQVHLWIGLVLGLYMLLIGTTGAILVFQDELTPAPLFSTTANHTNAFDLSAIARQVRTAFPKDKLEEVSVPTPETPYYSAFFKAMDGKFFTVYVQPTTGKIAQDPEPRWLNVAADLHFNLLAGRTGLILNGVGASFLLLLCISGLVIWWPGIKRWKRALGVNFKGRWKRINWDLHGAVGFWTLALLSLWAVSGIYFAWPTQVGNAINHISSVAAAVPPKFTMPPRSKEPWPALATTIHQAQLVSPRSQLSGIDFPDTNKDALVVYMARGAVGDFTRMDCVYFDPSTGRRLALWHRGVNPTLGSKFIFWLAPLHFGTQWGLPVKIIWAGCGLGLPILFLTGALMYWNRSLSKKWKALGKRSRVYPKSAITELSIHVRTDDRLERKIERSNPC